MIRYPWSLIVQLLIKNFNQLIRRLRFDSFFDFRISLYIMVVLVNITDVLEAPC